MISTRSIDNDWIFDIFTFIAIIIFITDIIVASIIVRCVCVCVCVCMCVCVCEVAKGCERLRKRRCDLGD